MDAKPVTLRTWADSQLGECAPKNDETLRRWVRDGKIVPRPKKVGKGYAVQPDARFVNFNDEASLADLI